MQNIQNTREKEAIHSGHFMVSHFEAEDQDDEDDVAVPVPETEVKNSFENIPEQFQIALVRGNQENGKTNQQLSIETNLSKLFQCMSLAYRQKLTSPKWNRFRGIKLRWKDKIRLNNVIWRCWHMQFIMKQNTLICQFASPLDVDTHNKPEAIVLEGKYWKRKLQAVTAEYKKWRMFYRNQAMGCNLKDTIMTMAEREALSWNSQSNDGLHMMVDEDYMDFMSDTLFSTISTQPFAFPDSREIARAGLADFIQPSLGPLQPNLDDFMDTFEPLQEFIISKLPPVPEEQPTDNTIYKQQQTMGWEYADLDATQLTVLQQPQLTSEQYHNSAPPSLQLPDKINPSPYTQNDLILGLTSENFTNLTQQIPQYQQQHQQQQTNPTVIATKAKKPLDQQQIVKIEHPYQTSKLYDYTLQTIDKDPLTIEPARAYKFPAPVQLSVKFSNQEHDIKVENTGGTGAVSRPKTHHQRRQRSRSSSRDQTQNQRPPLLSAVSDPAIMTSGSSVLLTQLLTSNNHLRQSSVQSSKDKLNQTSSSVLVKREDSHPVAILSAPPTPSASSVSTLIITNPTQSTSEQIILNSMAGNQCTSPVLDPSSRDSPESPLGSRYTMIGSPGSKDDVSPPHRDQRRAGHIHAEQKRRYNIKNGFDMIHSLIPHLNQNPNTKLSKAAMLQKGADYIRQLRSERSQLREEMDNLRQQIECLNTSISNCQSMLPATGAPVSRRRDSKMQDMFEDYVRTRTIDNWKFWIFSLMIKPLLVSYNNFVSTSSLEDLYRSTLHWVEQHCTLVDLRPVVLNSLRFLCTKTEILASPERLPDEAREAVMNSKQVFP